ncbi:MAG: tetratricopeptide repeat protein, partial [Thermodesulfobacteriota bacterium]
MREKASEWQPHGQRMLENKELFGKLSPAERGKLYLVLGKTRHEHNDFTRALEVSESALEELKIAHPDGNHLDIAAALNAVGENLFYLERYKEALPKFEEGFIIRNNYYEKKDHPDLAESLSNVGASLFQCALSLDDKADALKWGKNALEMWERLCEGKDHPGYARSLNNVGCYL